MQGAEHHNIIDPLFFMFRYSVPAFRMIKIATNVSRLCRFWHKVNAYAYLRDQKFNQCKPVCDQVGIQAFLHSIIEELKH